MMTRFLSYLGLLAVLALWNVSASAEEVLTWRDCVKEARAHHPDLMSALEKINQAKANKDILRGGLFPKISTDLGADWKKPGSNDEVHSFDAGLTGKQLLFDGRKTRYDIEGAQSNIDFTEYQYEVISSNIRLRLRTAFIGVVKAQDMIRITKGILERRKKSFELVKLRYEVGREHRGALLTAEANFAQAQFDVAQAKRGLDLAQRNLAKELGQKIRTGFGVQGDYHLPENTAEEVDFEALSDQTPLLKEIIAQKEAARSGVKSARADIYPKIFANSNAGHNSALDSSHEDEWAVGVSLTLPLYEGGAKRSAISKAEAILRQTEADERSGRDGVLLTLAQTWTALQDAAELVEVQRKFLEADEERSKIAEAQYSVGLVTFNDWTIIEDNLVRTQKLYLETRANALTAEANWRQAKGATLSDESD